MKQFTSGYNLNTFATQMKYAKLYIVISVLSLTLLSNLASAQLAYKNEPLILAKTENTDIFMQGQWFTRRWRISPQIPHDTLNIKLYSSKEPFAFRTDVDSIRFDIRTGETKSFYVKLGDAPAAHTIISASSYQWDKIAYEKASDKKGIKFFYRDNRSSYFDTLRRKYPLVNLIKTRSSDKEKVLTIMNWVHHQWKHDGGNAPKGSTGVEILDEAKAGGRFPCFAYAIVLVDQLTAQGYSARVLYLKTKDAATRKGSPGHVAAEVYLNDLKKWVFIDGQFNVMPELKGRPLNAIEFQHALSSSYDNVVLASKDLVSKAEYTSFVYDYLYYFDTEMDNRPVEQDKKFKLEGKTSAMLVPSGAPNLTKMEFFGTTITACVYTNSADDFYAQPTRTTSKLK